MKNTKSVTYQEMCEQPHYHHDVKSFCILSCDCDPCYCRYVPLEQEKYIIDKIVRTRK